MKHLPVGGVKSQAFVATALKKPFDKKSVVCYYFDKKGHMKRDCYKQRADEANGKNKPSRGGRDGSHGGGPQAGAFLVCTAAAVQPGSSTEHGSTGWSST